MKLLCVIGAASPPGRLAAAVAWLAEAVAAGPTGDEAGVVNLASAPVAFCDARADSAYDAPTRAAVAAAGEADAVLLASPVYRASYSGVLKNYLDLLPVAALRDKPVGIVAMGGSPHHYLGVDSQLRPVLAWFGALTLPNSVYLTGKDFSDGRLSAEPAMADLMGLAESLRALAAARQGQRYGPPPLAAKWS